MTPEDFIINHDYKVKEMFDDPAGKYSSFMKNSILMEQQYFFERIFNDIKQKTLTIMNRHK